MPRHTIRRPAKRRVQMRALVHAAAGPEPAYPVYQFSNGKRKIERRIPPGTQYPSVE